VAREAPGTFSVPCTAFTRVSRIEQRSWRARHQECEIGRVALLPRHASSAAKSGTTCRRHGASATAWRGQDLRSARSPQTSCHQCNQRRNRQRTDQEQRFSWASADGKRCSSLRASNEKGRPTRPQHPMRGRSLARRFRGSVRATLCVALPERTGRARVSGRTLGAPLPIINGRWAQLVVKSSGSCCARREDRERIRLPGVTPRSSGSSIGLRMLACRSSRSGMLVSRRPRE
jgi:hypothetical protein